MGVDIDDKEMAMAVLNGLPERFNSLISALDALGNEDEAFSLDFVKRRYFKKSSALKAYTGIKHQVRNFCTIFYTR